MAPVMPLRRRLTCRCVQSLSYSDAMHPACVHDVSVSVRAGAASAAVVRGVETVALCGRVRRWWQGVGAVSVRRGPLSALEVSVGQLERDCPVDDDSERDVFCGLWDRRCCWLWRSCAR